MGTFRGTERTTKRLKSRALRRSVEHCIEHLTHCAGLARTAAPRAPGRAAEYLVGAVDDLRPHLRRLRAHLLSGQPGK